MLERHYVRCIGRDIAYQLGACATLTGISRVAAAGVQIADSIDVHSLESIEISMIY